MLAKKKLKKFELISHTADLKFRIYGKDYSELLKNSLLALEKFWSPKLTKKKLVKKIKIDGVDLIDIFVSFIAEVIALTYVKKSIFNVKNLNLNVEKNFLQAELEGYKFQSLKKDIKAVTYHQAKIISNKKKFIFEFIIDI